jgi:hypothetical protein
LCSFIPRDRQSLHKSPGSRTHKPLFSKICDLKRFQIFQKCGLCVRDPGDLCKLCLSRRINEHTKHNKTSTTLTNPQGPTQFWVETCGCWTLGNQHCSGVWAPKTTSFRKAPTYPPSLDRPYLKWPRRESVYNISKPRSGNSNLAGTTHITFPNRIYSAVISG